MKIYYGKAIYNKKEINASLSVLKSKSLTLIDGPLVKELEKKISKLFGKKYGLMVNSGSSANLLALASLNLKKGDEVITPTLTFSTTVAPIYQLGLTPHFIDVESNSFVAKIDQIKKAINKKTKAIMVPNLLGNVPNWKNIFQIAKKKNIKIIEDSADTIGYRVQKKNLGKYSDITTNSMYASHIITGAGFGGMVCFNDKKTYERAKLLRGWGRSSAIFNESEGIKKRNSNFVNLKNFFSNFPNYFDLPSQQKGLITAWLAYPIIIKNGVKLNRQKLQIFLEKKGIQTRTIFTGNILRQPIMKKRFYKKVKDAELNSNNIMHNGVLIGCHHGLNNKDLNYIKKTFSLFMKEHIL